MESIAAEPRAGSAQQTELRGGQLLSAISNGIVKLSREHYGRGPIKAKTYAMDNIMCACYDVGLIPLERTLMDGGEPERILALRDNFKRMMASRYKELIQELTCRWCWRS